MIGAAQARLLPDGRRLHLHHGPIDIIAEAYGAPAESHVAYDQAVARFASILDELVDELKVLREPAGTLRPAVRGAVAARMVDAVWPHRGVFITPMAAVAGAVADEVLAAMLAGRTLRRAYVNNGGDIAFHLAPGERLCTAVVASLDRPAADATMTLPAAWPARGLATSGWQGRSFSLGIADAVTAFAVSAAAADAAATLIANAVDLEHSLIERRPASLLRDDTDLGDLPVTVAVGILPPPAVALALARGVACAERMRRAGLVLGARLELQGRSEPVGVELQEPGARERHERSGPAAQDHHAVRGDLP